MAKVWIIEKKIGDDTDYFLGSETEFKALQQALYEIVEEIQHADYYWDLTITSVAEKAKQIHDYAHSNDIYDLRSGIREYNTFMSNTTNPVHKWNIFATNIQEPETIMKLDDSFFGLDEKEEEPSEEEIKEDVKLASVCNGATCRKCGSYNEYAQADTSDGSFLCGQCKTFTKVFSQVN
jgi:formylmethanofuran dehydrogenase subunit E